ncbi:uncharacterized protein LOC141629117 [Silene latifolia]|uniref:uncharacterized protein LOC141629117 n=1 Tax=Silene latifolia TaxID=37657 RepID=UPI003D77F991
MAFSNSSSAIIQGNSPPKLEDLGSFSIPCTIGDQTIEKALCYLGASVKVMPYSVCERLCMGELKCTSMTLQMADRSTKKPLGVLEDVPVRVGKFFISVDFLIVDMAEDAYIPIILRRPFLNTAGAVIDVKHGMLTLEVGDEKGTFNLNKAMKAPQLNEPCFVVDLVEKKDIKKLEIPSQEPIKEEVPRRIEKEKALLNWKQEVDEIEIALFGELGIFGNNFKQEGFNRSFHVASKK